MPGYVPRPASPIFRKLLEKYARQEAILVVGHNPNLSQFLGRNHQRLRLRGLLGTEERRSGQGGNAANLRYPAVVPDSALLRTLYETAVESSRPKTSRK